MREKPKRIRAPLYTVLPVILFALPGSYGGTTATITTTPADRAQLFGNRSAAGNQEGATILRQRVNLESDSLRFPLDVKFDGADLWVASTVQGGVVYRVRASDGKLLETWTGAGGAAYITIALGRVFVAANSCPGKLYMIDPGQPAGVVTTVTKALACAPQAIAFDGSRIWTANNKSLSFVTPAAALPWPVTTVSPGLANAQGILYDGSHIWVTDREAGALLKMDAQGNLVQTVSVGQSPIGMVFDGDNIWVLNSGSNNITIVAVATGKIRATVSGNGLAHPSGAAFDGQRILVTNVGGSTVSLWNAADLTPLGSFQIGVDPFKVCSDGANFWVTLRDGNKLVRF